MVLPKTHKWQLVVYTDQSKTKVARVLQFATMRCMADAVGCPHAVLSNFYHNLINARGNCRYVDVRKCAATQHASGMVPAQPFLPSDKARRPCQLSDNGNQRFRTRAA